MNPENSVKISSYTFRNFIRRLNNAAIKKKYRENQLEEIGDRMKTLSKLSAEKKPSKKQMDKELEKLEMKIREIAAEEKVMVIRQKNEQNEMDELREKIKMLEEKMEGLSHVHSVVTDSHHNRIIELQSALKKAGKIEKTPEEEIKRFIIEKVKPIEEAEKKKAVKLKALEKARQAKKLRQAKKAQKIKKAKKSKKLHPMVIKSLKKKISDAEKLHTRLKKKGHPKEDLQRLKKVIDGHKERLGKLK